MIKALASAIVLLSAVLNLALAQADNRQLTLTGSSTIAPLAMEIAKRYESQHPDVRIDVQMGGSSRGINDTRMGLADIGMVSRPLKSTEQDLTPFQIAMDGIGIILHKSNAVTALSDAQIIDIYTGKINNWQKLGAADLPITVVNKAEGRSTLELFLHYFSLKNSQIKAQVVIGENQQGIKTVAGNPGAIGYVSIGTAEYEQALGTPIKLLPMAGQVATVASVAQGAYPLSRQLNLVVKAKPEGLVKNFINFAQSAEVKDLIVAQFFVAPFSNSIKSGVAGE
ncbi:phosphate ABC transporter substrate-binding protein [Dasania sp. GY-MA-18]|uniref:Phosphate ABC transporter substrate-binding protein n=1 Tax=Dasania phycosphaerae TaxID=2950436 RepID=A0A9J6RJ71_9GAMM|nr:MULTISPECIES: phosphate ABC transporter substrate-binding protein [Dasania]MCR8921868.1 phosphate ABC transporter substrate-binding protein [Dasania sp. GY-MA-18]MCZ0864296.1 phosphate ABC transporter substrate-binding protein [Dasania phycosphaerae]MCZ0868024.1 phosphate ABC transporter substrate-binding protein [Dasania phycosphaerae]